MGERNMEDSRRKSIAVRTGIARRRLNGRLYGPLLASFREPFLKGYSAPQNLLLALALSFGKKAANRSPAITSAAPASQPRERMWPQM
jgi:hypothetical protein